ncbi:sigma-E processing peptidase SpoIIGA [Bacillus coahuilensis]|uniref:sigma-E processing peptidase SpoIIGA n=1 Tax=Bacillus coahuilensis TaxID=408580 RepID=UPI0001850E6F|nr:sigma-E processing peptidase SpoIIGA [Bacillus coahuilensis]
MVVYLDIIWLLNFLVDSMLLALTALFLKRSVKLWRFFIGGFIGSIILISYFMEGLSFLLHPVGKIVVSIFMVLATFGYKRWKYFVQSLGMFYFLSFLAGGMIIGSHYFIQWDKSLLHAVSKGSVQGFGDPISWVFVLLGFPVIWYFSQSQREQIQIINIQYDQLVTVKIKIIDISITVKGLVDSGNQLVDPLSKSPVMIVSIQNIQEQFHPLFVEWCKDEEQFNLPEQLEDQWLERVRLIPAKSIGKEHQMLKAFKPDLIEIMTNDQSYVVKKGLVSFTTRALSADDVFDCIVQPKMVSDNAKGKVS